MKKVKFSFRTTKVGSEQTKTFEVDDETTEEELDLRLNEWVLENSDSFWEYV